MCYYIGINYALNQVHKAGALDESTSLSRRDNMIKEFRKNYFFLSNFYPCIVVYDGITYSSSEATYQAQKILIILKD